MKNVLIQAITICSRLNAISQEPKIASKENFLNNWQKIVVNASTQFLHTINQKTVLLKKLIDV